MAAGLLVWWQSRSDHASRATPHASAIAPALIMAALALVVAVFTFALTSPFAILDWENFSRAVLTEQGAMVRGAADFPFTRQYRGTIPYLYQIEQLVRWGIGWPLGLLAFAAFRLFDIWKPWPVGPSQNLPGGWGVTVDDVLAALYVNLVWLVIGN